MATIKTIAYFICCCSFITFANAQCSMKTATPRFRRGIFDFTAEIIKGIANEEENHFVISPLSLWALLSVTAEGAKGQTLKEIRLALRLPKHTCFRNKYYQLIKYLSEESDNVTFERSGLIVLDRSLQVQNDFADRVRSQLVADVKNLDFNDTYNTARYINDYAKMQTHGNINEIVQQDDFKDALMLLVDTVYFKAYWNESFDPDETAPNIFFDDYQNEIGQVNLMYTCGWFNVAEMKNIKARILELPYGSEDRFAMLIILPDDDTHLKTVIDNLDLTTIAAIYHEFGKNGKQIHDVFLPRFKIESTLETIKDVLGHMGVKKVFHSTADLSGMVDTPHYIDKITQKAYIEVNEEGTIAAAASTAFLIPRMMPNLFQANKPFLYLIIEKITHVVMFSGAYSKPSLE